MALLSEFLLGSVDRHTNPNPPNPDLYKRILFAFMDYMIGPGGYAEAWGKMSDEEKEEMLQGNLETIQYM